MIARDGRKPGLFSEIALAGDYALSLKLGGSDLSVAVEADRNLLPEIDTSANGRRLKIAFARALAPSRRVSLSIEAPDVSLIRCNGRCDVEVQGIDNQRFQIDLIGGGSARATGTTRRLEVHVTGSGAAHLEALRIDGGAVVDVSGAGSVDVAAPTRLDVEIHGSGAVSYEGSPTINQTIRDAGTLRKR